MRRMRWGLPAAAVALAAGLATAPAGATPTPAETVAAWVVSLQFSTSQGAAPESDGAIRVHHEPGAYVAPLVGPGYFRVVPYFANEAIAGLVRSKHPGRLDVAERWIAWYLAHRLRVATPAHPRGAILDHWYRADGSGETVCPPSYQMAPDPTPYCAHADADDAYAGTFLAAVLAYAEAGGGRAARFLSRREVKAGIEAVADAILALQDPDDGLTWALPLCPFKYLMDNSEVFEGLSGIAALEDRLWGDAGAAALYRRAAGRARQGIASLLDPATGLYHWAKDALGGLSGPDLSHWYPDSVALVWPHLRGVTPPDAPVAQAQFAALDEAWDGSPGADWTSHALGPIGELYPSVGYAALLAGGSARAAAHAAFVVGCAVERGFRWPFTVGDGGWLLRTLGAVSLPPPGCPT